MKKKFLNYFLCSLLMVGASFFVASCSDDDTKYDDSDVRTLISGLQTQLNAVDLNSVTTTANQALSTANEALAAAQAAQASALTEDEVKAIAKDIAQSEAAAAIANATILSASDVQSMIDASLANLSTGGLTSDQVKALMAEELTDINSALTALNNSLTTLETNLGALTTRVESLDATVSDLSTTVTNLTDQVSKFESALGSLASNATSQAIALLSLQSQILANYGGASAELDALIAELKAGTKTYADVDWSEVSEWIAAVNENLEIIDAIALKSLVFIPQAYLKGVQAMKVITMAYNAWEPKTYYGSGAGEWSNASLKGEIWDAPVLPRTTDFTTFVAPQMVAYYHLNPANVTAGQIKAVSCVSEDYEYISRAAASLPEVKSWEVVGDGTLKVTFTIDAEEIYAIDEDYITTIALQVTVKSGSDETPVTSDYAAVYREFRQQFTLALKDKEDEPVGSSSVVAPAYYHNELNQRHLYGSDNYTDRPDASTPNFGYTDVNGTIIANYDIAGRANVAVDLAADYTLNYTATTIETGGLNLTEKIAVHYVTAADKANATVNGEFGLTAAELANHGLALKFYKSDYIQGSNNTHQNDFFDLMTDAKGDTYVVAKVFTTNGTAAVDREPLIRVELVDVNNNNAVVNAGWIKVLIVKDAASGADEVYDFADFTVHCDNQVYQNTVEQMNYLYNGLGYTKTEFHTLYTLSTEGGVAGANAIPYASTGTATYGDDYMGTVVEKVDAGTTETNLLTWTISSDDMEYALENTDGELYITVVYKGNGLPDVTVKLTTTVVDVSATMESKIANYWNADKTSIYVNSEIPGTLTNLADFHTDIDNTFVGNKPVFTITPSSAVTAYPNDYDWSMGNMHYYYQFRNAQYTFTGASGVTYRILADNTYVNPAANGANQSYSYLIAYSGTRGVGAQLVATIDTYTGVIEYNNGNSTLTGYGANPSTTSSSSVTPVPVLQYNGDYPTVVYPDNSIAEDILNAVEAGNEGMFYAPIETILYNGCRNIKVTNGSFNAGFYRPVNVHAGDARTFVDSNNSGQTLNYVNLVTLTDWRYYVGNSSTWGTGNFYTKALGAAWNSGATPVASWATYWAYYDVLSMKLDVDNVTTTMNGGTLGTTKLSDVTNQIVLEDNGIVNASATVQGWATAGAANYGHVKYTNNGNPITSSFVLRLPITVTYKWGEITVPIDVTVVD